MGERVPTAFAGAVELLLWALGGCARRLEGHSCDMRGDSRSPSRSGPSGILLGPSCIRVPALQLASAPE